MNETEERRPVWNTRAVIRFLFDWPFDRELTPIQKLWRLTFMSLAIGLLVLLVQWVLTATAQPW
jgi:hypothetical protein